MKEKHRMLLLTGCVLTAAILLLTGCRKRQEDVFELEEYTAIAEEAPEASDKEPEKRQTAGNVSMTADEQRDSAANFCYLHICGQVRTPGVYKLTAGSRVCDAVRQAGGFTELADENYVNQAETVSDGMKIVIPSWEETQKHGAGPDGYGILTAEEEKDRVNLNTASREKLCTLPGIGESRADSIIAYREQNGGFQKVEEIMQIDGIKEGAFAKLKDSVCVR